MKSIMGKYKDDEPDGLWRQWNGDGQQSLEKTFDADAAAEANNDSSIDLFGGEDADVGESIEFESAEDGSIESMLDRGEGSRDLEPDSHEDEKRSSNGTDMLEDISPAEMESEELPLPNAAAREDSSARFKEPKQTTEEEDQFFRISF